MGQVSVRKGGTSLLLIKLGSGKGRGSSIGWGVKNPKTDAFTWDGEGNWTAEAKSILGDRKLQGDIIRGKTPIHAGKEQPNGLPQRGRA